LIKKLTKLFEKYGIDGIHKSLHLAISQSFIAFLFILVDYIFSKQLTVSEFGVWKEIYFFFNLGIPLLAFGIPEGYKYFIAKEQQLDYYFKNLLSLLLLVSIGTFLLLVVLNFFHWIGTIDLGHFYLYSLLFPLPLLSFLLNKILRYTFININKAEELTKLSLLGALGSLVIILIGAYFIKDHQNLVSLIAVCIYFSIFFFPAIFYLKELPQIKIKFGINRLAFKNILVYGFPLYLGTFAGILSNYLDKLIVNVLEDEVTFAIFAVGAFEIPIFAMMSAAFSQQIFPNMVSYVESNQIEKANKLWLKTTKKVSLITYPVILVTMFFAEEIIFLIYNENYEGSVILLKTYLLVALFRNNSYGILLTTKGETKMITKFAFGMLAVNLLASISLFYYFGLTGIVFGTLISTVFYVIIVLLKEHIFIDYLKYVVFSKKILVLTILILITYFFS